MSFKSVFIGIDRYQSSLISNLSCSVRDAKALHGLFGDAFGTSESLLLTNELATRSAILKGIQNLQLASPDDVVVIGFSGHGSDSHHLITYDADPLTLDATAIHLDELTDLFSRIPAANLVLLLDCCFAGGAGSKVFHAPVAAKAPASAEALLNKISGRGRIIFTAATADQEAIEDRRRGHGLFTFYVIEGLRGAPEIVKAGSIPVLSLLQFVSQSVIEAARQIRHQQEPTVKGVVEGELRFPVLAPGPIYKGFFPECAATPVGPAISDLVNFGFPPPIIQILQTAIPSLNELQQDAINKAGLFDGQHLVVSAPTTSGKTMIGELAALHGFTKGERSYMLLPLRALVNDKYDEFTAKYGSFGLRIIRSTGEIADDNDSLLRGKFDIAFLTYERFAALALTVPHIMRQVGVIVIDEVQMITDRNRGANLEFVLTLLKAQRLLGIEPQMIALSAVIGDTNGFESWLNARLLYTEKRPVPLDEGLIDMNGAFRYVSEAGKEEVINNYARPEYRKGSSQDIIIPLVRQLVAGGEKVIVFRETKPIVRATAEYLKNNLGLSQAIETLNLLPMGDPSAASAQLRGCLEHGVGFHNADLDREERQAIEATFRDPASSLKVLVATTTLAMGVNTPAWSVVIAGLEHPGSPYSVAEYKNMVGRAGRLGFTPKGKSFLVAPTQADAYHLWNTYVLGKPESLVSRFSDQEPLSLVCRVLATAAASKANSLSEQELVDFIHSTFAAHQKGQYLDAATVSGTLERLLGGGLVERIDDRYRLTELGKVAGELGIQVESVVRISRSLRGLSAGELTDTVLLAAAQTAVELDEVIFPVHRTSTKERDRWQGAVRQQHLPPSVASELRAIDGRGYTARCKRLSAVLMWIDGVELNRMEASLLLHLPGDNAAGPIRASAERTRDLIGVVTRIGTLVSTNEGSEPSNQIDQLSIRLELGIPVDMLWLAKELKRSLERGDYLALRRAGLTTVEAIDAADKSALARVITGDVKIKRIREAIERIKQAKPVNTDDLPMPLPAMRAGET
ncbi:MAG TPA: DEAD/DEAH box helicase [Acidobacteriota bacterium]|jgi:replicative superfamily II helicase